MTAYLKSLIEGKKILILGFGREGKSTWHMLKKTGGYRELDIADQNFVVLDEENPGKLITGSEYQHVLNDYDLVFKSPGIVLEHEPSAYRCRIVSQTEVFFERYRDQIVGITGTKGKSTTTTLLHHVLKEAGVPVLLAGNIGVPVLNIADQVKEDTVIVVELSSHQLEYMTVSPRISVLTNIHEEHLDHYGTMEKYVAAKENIYRHQKEGDLFFCNEENLPAAGTCAAKVISVGLESDTADIQIYDTRVVYGERSFTIPEGEMQLFGHHNYFNIGVVYGIAGEFGLDNESVKKGLITYETLPHRLQYFGTYNGVKYFDDSISTICDTTIQALSSLKDVNTVLIGGMDRGIDYGDLITFLSGHPVEHIILMAATGKRIYQEILRYYPDFKGIRRISCTDTLKKAVEIAIRVTAPGTSCVLSPAAASYGIFKNFEERGEMFQKWVKGGTSIDTKTAGDSGLQ